MNRESIHQFGEKRALLGILTEPESMQAEGLCFVILNAGLLHRVGPYRMHVDLARAVAGLGMPCFRFDLSGLGDSQPRDGDLSDAARAIADIREAFDYLKSSKGYTSFVIFGLCSGADNAHAVGLVDHRLVGAIMLDGPGYPNVQYKVHNYVPKIFKKEAWVNTLKRLFKSENRALDRQEIYVRTFSPKEQVEAEINDLLRRGVELLYIYTGGVECYYNHASQFAENFPSLKVNTSDSRIQCVYYRASDHTYTDLGDRAQMFSRVLRWVQEKYTNKCNAVFGVIVNLLSADIIDFLYVHNTELFL
jgi:pimeloyl-ACP methyl ester carboxylesterase